jgi:hypothetical protein
VSRGFLARSESGAAPRCDRGGCGALRSLGIAFLVIWVTFHCFFPRGRNGALPATVHLLDTPNIAWKEWFGWSKLHKSAKLIRLNAVAQVVVGVDANSTGEVQDRRGYPASARLGDSEIDLHNRTWLRLRRIHYRCGDRHGGHGLHQWMMIGAQGGKQIYARSLRESWSAALSAFQAAPRKTIIAENSIHTIKPIAAASPP